MFPDNIFVSALLALLFLWNFSFNNGNPNEKRLYDDLFRKRAYNKLIRPVANDSERLIIRVGLKLTQLLDIDEKNQVMMTNVWLPQEWQDYNLKWNPEEYGGVNLIYLPAEDIWLPDIVLYNNADGNYEITIMTKAKVNSSGYVRWEPPAIYKSSCEINVEFFPFDEQWCHMKFGSWTYGGQELDLQHEYQARVNTSSFYDTVYIDPAINVDGYYPSVEWDLMHIPANRNAKLYPCCPDNPYVDVTFNITLRRKTLFYTVNLIIPCVFISFLTVLVFYLPSDSGEKITLCISILLSLTVFFLLLAEIIPPTSLVVPLIGKYLLFTMILVTLSIVMTVAVLNIHYRSSATHILPHWIRVLFMEVLPRILLMRRLPDIEEQNCANKFRASMETLIGHEASVAQTELRRNLTLENISRKSKIRRRMPCARHSKQTALTNAQSGISSINDILRDSVYGSDAKQEEVYEALENLCFIANHLQIESDEDKSVEDWMYIAMVLDRLFLWLFTAACLVGTMCIIFTAPTLYDDRKPHLHE